jgi:hypothetical protein
MQRLGGFDWLSLSRSMAYDCILLKTAQKFLDEDVTPGERKHLVEVLEQICNDPVVDGITKFYFPVPPVVVTLYREPEWWIVYYSPRDNVLHIINIGRVTEPVNVRRAS